MRTFFLFLCSLAGGITATELPPTYVCGRADIPPIIDGRGDDALWKSARELSPLRDIEGARIPHECRIKMAWDDAYLYIFADMEEKHLWATLREHDSVIYRDPDFEVFIDPDGDGLNYIELEINALNTTWDLFIPRPYRFNSSYILHDWEIPGLKHAVHLRGTLNDATDTDSGWSVELAIPWSSITGHGNQPRRGTAPKAGSSMRFNFSRVNWQVRQDASSPCGYTKLKDESGNPLPESNHVWAPTGKINIHLPEYWGRVKFSSRSAAVWESTLPELSEETRLSIFHALNIQLKHRGKYGNFNPALTLPAGVQIVFPSDNFFILKATCPRSGVRMTLDSEGRFTRSAPKQPLPEIFLWVHGNRKQTAELWERQFREYVDAGITTLIIGDSAEHATALTPIADKVGLRVYAWLWALNRPQDDALLQHPEWFAVNALGKSCHNAENRPFVEYYRFLCPNQPGVLRYLLQQVRQIAAIPGLTGIQADYMRMPDVKLPRGLWGKYGLDMTHTAPQYDYCYCSVCRQLFKEQYGRAPLPAPATDAEWTEFRLNSIAGFYNALAAEIRKHHLSAACAVFPTPSAAGEMVRQDWKRFCTDLALPMVYHSFYNEEPAWGAAVSRQAADETDRRFPLALGLHLPDFTPEQFIEHLETLSAVAPHGIALFSDEEILPQHLRTLKNWLQKKCTSEK